LVLGWLARREHSSRELEQKLLRKGCSPTLARVLIADLTAQRLVSDDRFMEMLVRVRRARGHGPVRIAQELQQKGIGAGAISDQLDFSSPLWLEEIERVRTKKFGSALPCTPAERAKQARFLQYRGFTQEQIRRVLNSRDED
jgi:regulatory protein